MEMEDEIQQKRDSWRKIRVQRLEMKKDMLAAGKNRQEIRKIPQYRRLEKLQKQLSTRIRHLEKKMNRNRNRLTRDIL
ncbi:MAG: hypothetical protein ACOCX9_02040 [Spirochaetota bacterium]